MEMKFEHITPERAEAALATSKGNPRWKNKTVDYGNVSNIARDIEAGNWKPGNGSIAFDEDGNLIDGHHRMKAVVMANKPIDVWVCYGVDADGKNHIDDNKSRTVTQRMGVNKFIPGMASMHMKCKMRNSKTVATVAEIEAFMKTYKNELDAVLPLGETQKGAHITTTSYFLYSALCALRCGVPFETVSKFGNSLNTGFIDGDEESAVIAVRNQLVNLRPKTNRERISASYVLQAAIADYAAGKPRRKAYRSEAPIYTDMMED